MIKPLGVHVLVEPLEEPSSMVIPELSKGQAKKGIVRGIGNGVEDKELKVGDTVIYRQYSPEEYELDGKVVYLIEEVDLFGIEYGETQSEPS